MNIYVGNLSYDVTEDELRQALEAFGQVETVNIIKDKFSGQSKGFDFEMPSADRAKSAIEDLNGKELKEERSTSMRPVRKPKAAAPESPAALAAAEVLAAGAAGARVAADVVIKSRLSHLNSPYHCFKGEEGAEFLPHPFC